MIVALLLSAILVFHSLPSVHSQLAEGQSCVTPNQERAVCTKVRSCTVIANALNTPSEQAVNFARQSQCGYSTEPLVCCGSSGLFTTKSVYVHRLLPTPDKCGIGSTIWAEQGRTTVHYGEEAELREFPWTALLGYVLNGKREVTFACGGSLINNRYVLTAAHCVKNSNRILTTVRLGEYNLAANIDCEVRLAGNASCNPAAEDYEVEYTVKHPSYTFKQKTHDIALVRLKRNVEFQVHIQPVCLPADSTSQMVDTPVTVAGWGETEKGAYSPIKLKADLKVIPLQKCANQFSSLVQLTDTQYCASGYCQQDNTKCADTCKGDSGGPSIRAIRLVSEHKTDIKWIQEGITSFGLQICGQGYPAVYTRVSKYVQWIVDNLKD